MTLQELANAFGKAKDAQADAMAKRKSAEARLLKTLDQELEGPIATGVYVRIGDSVLTKEYGELTVAPLIVLDGSLPVVDIEEGNASV